MLLPVLQTPACHFPLHHRTSAAVRRFPKKRRSPRSSEIPIDSSDEPSSLENFTALASSKSQQRRAQNPSPPPPSTASTSDPSVSSPTLRGSDVLLALQRAVAKKEMQREERKRSGGRRTARTTGWAPEDLDEGEVRPITIRSDWLTRMDELEKRIKELQQH